jgi:hypothetical protein
LWANLISSSLTWTSATTSLVVPVSTLIFLSSVLHFAAKVI